MQKSMRRERRWGPSVSWIEEEKGMERGMSYSKLVMLKDQQVMKL